MNNQRLDFVLICELYALHEVAIYFLKNGIINLDSVTLIYILFEVNSKYLLTLLALGVFKYLTFNKEHNLQDKNLKCLIISNKMSKIFRNLLMYR